MQNTVYKYDFRVKAEHTSEIKSTPRNAPSRPEPRVRDVLWVSVVYCFFLVSLAIKLFAHSFKGTSTSE